MRAIDCKFGDICVYDYYDFKTKETKKGLGLVIKSDGNMVYITEGYSVQCISDETKKSYDGLVINKNLPSVEKDTFFDLSYSNNAVREEYLEYSWTLTKEQKNIAKKKLVEAYDNGMIYASKVVEFAEKLKAETNSDSAETKTLTIEQTAENFIVKVQSNELSPMEQLADAFIGALKETYEEPVKGSSRVRK